MQIASITTEYIAVYATTSVIYPVQISNCASGELCHSNKNGLVVKAVYWDSRELEALSLMSWGKSLNFSGLQFLICKMGVIMLSVYHPLSVLSI